MKFRSNALLSLICSMALPLALLRAQSQAGADNMIPPLTVQQASGFAKLALKGIQQPFPNKPGDVWNNEADAGPPRVLHPAFYGSYDWHSSVHGHWMLVRLLRQFPELPERDEIRRVLGRHLTVENLKVEASSFKRANAQSYERPYGWAWSLKLAEELHGWNNPQAREWEKNLQPLTDHLVRRYLSYFPKQTYPIRSGVHSNTAFGLAFAIDFAEATGNASLLELLRERGQTYYGSDEGLPAKWEPDGADFFSPSLTEADLMRRILPGPQFQRWLAKSLPDLARGEPKSLLYPPQVTDRSDPQIVHLDGLSLSRAWCMKNIAKALPSNDPVRRVLEESVGRHAQAGLAHVASGDYAGEHWLASFAVFLNSNAQSMKGK